ncbi:MAG: hypothetical protein M3O15_15060 [Acidobacteriota bacterium]|nr:hypothetical protein [Acidobacteriota bacterium]
MRSHPTTAEDAGRAAGIGWRWLFVWGIAAGIFFTVWSSARRLLTGSLTFTAEDLVQLTLVPAVQTATLAGLTGPRRRR